MRGSRVFFLCCGVIGAVAVGALTVYAARRPVVVVTDASFEELYGPERSRRRKIGASLAVYRRVVVAIVAESAADAAAADAAASASADPFCVVFPYRYEAGAVAYAERRQDVRTVVVGGPAETGARPPRFTADRATDLYRAGRVAGLLSSAGRPVLIGGGSELPRPFLAGLADSGFPGEPLLLAPGDPLPADAACVVAVDMDGRLSPELRALPLVLFSWIDLALVPASTVAVFDDSVWALLVPAVRAAAGGGAPGAPSAVWFPRTAGRKAPRQVKAAATARYGVHNSL